MDLNRPIEFDTRTTTASTLRERLLRFEVTSVELVERYYAEIELCNDHLKAVLCTAPKADVLRRAESLDKQRRSSKCGPLHGIPVLVKVSYLRTLDSC
jgi:Asp-tRNA(Asn)/Glu-tRNA(Gln) amidotransferase A subunit family amidase